VLPAHNEDVPTPQWRGHVETYAVDANTSRIPEEGAQSPSWPNGLLIIIIINSPSGPNRLILIIIIIIIIFTRPPAAPLGPESG
jgi:hypothetical protein